MAAALAHIDVLRLSVENAQRLKHSSRRPSANLSSLERAHRLLCAPQQLWIRGRGIENRRRPRAHEVWCCACEQRQC